MKRPKKNKSKVIEIPSSILEELNKFPINLYCDGGVIGKNPSKIGGTWCWCQVQRYVIIKNESGIVTPELIQLPTITNNMTELYAAIEGMKSLPNGWAEIIFTDSEVTKRRIKLDSQSSLIGVPDWLIESLKKEKNRLGNYSIELVKGHPSRKDLELGKDKNGKLVSKFNVWCDNKCNERSKKYLEAIR